MGRKTAKKEKRKAKDSIHKPVIETKDPDRKEEVGSFDFGGLPDRDLKKNLGCG